MTVERQDFKKLALNLEKEAKEPLAPSLSRLENLPPELIRHILKNLDADTLEKAACTSKELQTQTSPLWKKKLKRHFPHHLNSLQDDNTIIDWRQKFKNAKKIDYEGLPKKIRQLLSLFKEGNKPSKNQLKLLKSVKLTDFVDYPSLFNWILTADLTVRTFFYKLVLKKYTRWWFRVDVHKWDDQSRTILHWAILLNMPTNIIQTLIKKGADVEAAAPDFENVTPLHLAAKNNQLDIVNLLLANTNNAAAINPAANQRKTPLHFAVQYNHLEMVDLLLKKGANVNANLYDNTNSLHLAVENNNAEIVKILLVRPDINIDAAKKISVNSAEKNVTALHLAINNNNLQIVQLLLEKNAAVDPEILLSTIKNDQIVIAQELLKKNIHISKEIFEEAVRNGNLTFVEEILKKSKENNNNLDVGATRALVIAIENKYDNITGFLLGQYTYIVTGVFDSAIKNGTLNLVKQLLDKVSPDNQPDYSRLFKIAIKNNRIDIVNFLLEKKLFNIETMLKDNKNNNITALRVAIKHGHLDMVKFLLEKGADTTCPGFSAPLLHIAVLHNHIEIVKYLLEKKLVDINTTRHMDDCTALHLAAENNFTDIVNLLLENNADINAQRNDKMTALDLAIQNKHINIINALAIKNQSGSIASVNNDTTSIGTQNTNQPLHEEEKEQLAKYLEKIDKKNVYYDHDRKFLCFKFNLRFFDINNQLRKENRAAAEALLVYCKGDKSINLAPHNEALNKGKLASIAKSVGVTR